MARAIANELASIPIEQIVSSPLSRAVQTAHPLAERLGLDIKEDPRLLELDFGVYEGRPKSELGLKLRKSHAFRPVPGGEALIDAWHRAGAFLRSLQPAGRDVAIIGHYWINRMIYGHYLCLDFDSACRSRAYRPNTGSVIELRSDGPSCAQTKASSS